MKILCVGDSWTYGYGVNKNDTWPVVLSEMLGVTVDVTAKSGSTNREIYDAVKQSKIKDYDIVLIGWSGVTRNRFGKLLLEFSYAETQVVHRKRLEFFKEKTLEDIILPWEEMIDRLTELGNTYDTRIVHFSVFGDKTINPKLGFIKESFLEKLANNQNMFFNYTMPIFEFDWLCEENEELVQPFAKKYFPKDWEKAMVEREAVRPGINFLDCGHPNPKGHRVWAEFISEIIK